jgi:hypothetical protein
MVATMSQTGLSEFDNAVQKANLWLKDVAAQMQCDDRHRAYYALRTVLHAVRDHLPVESVVALAPVSRAARSAKSVRPGRGLVYSILAWRPRRPGRAA